MSYQHYQCDPTWVSNNISSYCRGVTTWNTANQYTAPLLGPNGTSTFSFTCTVPKCYSSNAGSPLYGRDSCNLVFNAWSNDSKNTDIELQLSINNNNLGSTYISGVATHGGTQTYDLGNAAIGSYYNDMAKNSFIVKNNSSSTIHLDHFKVYRVYKLCNLEAEAQGYCSSAYAGQCEPGSTAGTTGNLDSSRSDKPCTRNAGGGLSYTQYTNDTYKNTTITPGSSKSWTFDFSGNRSGGNYLGKSICLFNFNQVTTVGTASSSVSDVPVKAFLNGNEINTYWLSRENMHGMFPSHDLAQSSYYKDSGSNTVTLQNSGSATIKMLEAIDVYRIFRTSAL